MQFYFVAGQCRQVQETLADTTTSNWRHTRPEGMACPQCVHCTQQATKPVRPIMTYSSDDEERDSDYTNKGNASPTNANPTAQSSVRKEKMVGSGCDQESNASDSGGHKTVEDNGDEYARYCMRIPPKLKCKYCEHPFENSTAKGLHTCDALDSAHKCTKCSQSFGNNPYRHYRCCEICQEGFHRECVSYLPLWAPVTNYICSTCVADNSKYEVHEAELCEVEKPSRRSQRKKKLSKSSTRPRQKTRSAVAVALSFCQQTLWGNMNIGCPA